MAVDVQAQGFHETGQTVFDFDFRRLLENGLCVEIGQNEPGLGAERKAELHPCVGVRVEGLPCLEEHMGVALVLLPFPDLVGVLVRERGLTEHRMLIGDLVPCWRPVLDGQGRVYSPLRVVAWRLGELENVRENPKF